MKKFLTMAIFYWVLGAVFILLGLFVYKAGSAESTKDFVVGSVFLVFSRLERPLTAVTFNFHDRKKEDTWIEAEDEKPG